jgi:CrcB protein
VIERIVLVGIGAGAGGVARYLLSLWFIERFGAAFPYGTLAVNITGSFLLALLAGLAGERLGLSPEVRLLLGTGFCGGYTTFSTFAVETLLLAETRALPTAALNVVASVALSLLAAVAGLWLARLL